MQTVIKAENLSKKFRIGRLRKDEGTLRDLVGNILKYSFTKPAHSRNSNVLWALDNISFEVRQGDTLGIVGSNGAGKSTLLKILSRIIKPTSGKAVLMGRVGSILEVGTGFHQDLTGRENVFLNGAVLGMRRREVEKKFDQIVAFAEIEKFIDTPVKFYSTGMYMRLAFAVAAHLEPDILIVDEILAVGDATFQTKCLEKMSETVTGGRTILFVSHNSEMVEKLCKTALYLKKGKFENYGDTKTVLAQYDLDCQLSTFSNEDNLRDLPKVKENEIRFIEWNTLNSSSKSAYTIFSREKVILEFRLVCRRQLSNISFKVTIQDADGKAVFVASNDFVNTVGTSVKEGIYRLLWACELPIKAGFYQTVVEARSTDEDRVLDVWNCSPKLKVLPASEDPAAANSQGLVNTRVSLEIVCD